MKALKIILIFLGILIAIGYIFLRQNNTPVSEVKSISSPSVSMVVNQSNWEALSKEDIMVILLKEKDIYFEPDGGLGLYPTDDLTGDGIPEALVMGNGGNNTVVFILIKNSDGIVSVAKLQNKDGSIYPVSIIQVGRAMYESNYKVLPQERGFYTIFRQFNESAKSYECDLDQFTAYSWNNEKNLFEWNQTLVDKYIVQDC